MGLIVLIPPMGAAVLLSKLYLTGRGPPAGLMTTLSGAAYMLSPVFVIYTLLALFFLWGRSCPTWIKTLELVGATLAAWSRTWSIVMRVAEHLFEFALLVQCATKETHFCLHINVFKSMLHDHAQFANIDRSREVMSGSRLHRLDSSFYSAKRCDEDHSGLAVFAVKFPEQVDARTSRHLHIRNDEVGRLVPHDLQHLTSALCLAWAARQVRIQRVHTDVQSRTFRSSRLGRAV